MHMSPDCQSEARRIKYALLVTALAPALPQILGSAFNIWYNIAVVDPLLVTAALKRRFLQTIVVYNSICYPIGFYLWVRLVYSLRPVLERLQAGEDVPDSALFRGAPARDPSAIPWGSHYRRRLAALYSGVSSLAARGGSQSGRAPVLAFADFLRGIGFHLVNAQLFSG